MPARLEAALGSNDLLGVRFAPDDTSSFPTLTALQRFEALHARGPVTLSDLGLMLLPMQRNWCEDTPRNGRIFATTGGDGVHFCLLELAGRCDEESPVVMVVPCCPDQPRLIVGDTLLDFLALGSVTGFSFLEQLVYDFDEALGCLADRATFVQHSYFGGCPPPEDVPALESEQAILAELKREFKLTPWNQPREKFAALQEKWGSSVEL